MTATIPVTERVPAIRGSLSREDAATRQLCAAMLRDETLRKRFLAALKGNHVNGFGVSPGVDLGVVARYGLEVERRRKQRDFALCAVLVIGGLFALSAGAAAGSVTKAIPFAAAAFVVAWAFVAAERLVARTIVGRRLLPGAFDPEQRPPVPPDWAPRLAELDAGQMGNVTVYSGFWPFVGHGSLVGSWSFAINLQRPGKNAGATPQAIGVAELHECVASQLAQLGLANLTVKDRLLVDGRGIRNDRRFLPAWAARPRPSVPEDLVEQIRDHPERAARHYRCIRVVDWDGELVLTIFLNLTKLSHMLFAEAHYLLLPPLEDKVRSVDDLRVKPRAQEVATIAARSAFVTPFALAASPAPVIEWISEQVQFLRFWAEPDDGPREEHLKRVERTPSYDYGASATLRERQAGGFARYLQSVDKDMYVKVIEREIFDALVDFLDARDVDVSELRDRQNTILNYGVMANSVEAQNLVAGGNVTADLRRVVGAKSADD